MMPDRSRLQNRRPKRLPLAAVTAATLMYLPESFPASTGADIIELQHIGAFLSKSDCFPGFVLN